MMSSILRFQGPNSDPSLSISTTTSSPVVNKQEVQTDDNSDAHSKSKNTVPPRIKNTKSPEDNQTLGMQQEETDTVEQSSNIYKQTEATDKILMDQEPQIAKGTAYPMTKHSGYEEESMKVIKQGESAVCHEQFTKNKAVTEHDLPQVKKTSCSMSWPVCSGKQFDDTLHEVAKDMMTFTLDLFQKLSPLDSRPNLVISPISVALALSHLMLGANGKTKDDILKALYKGVKDVHCIHEAMQNLTTHGPFLSASEMFYNKELHINKEFIDQSSKFYGSKSIPLFKDKTKSLEKINSWVSQRTNGLIPTLLQELPPDLQLILVNVIHYQGKWLSHFDPSLTNNENFHRSSSVSVKVPTMNAHKYPLQIFKDTYLKAQVARFRLSGNFSLLILLPLGHAEDALKTMEKRLSQEIVNLLIKQLEEAPIRAASVSLPQINIDTNVGLNEALSSLGLYDLFEHPDLCALSNSTDLAVSNVAHHALLQIKEEGVKAVAASTISIARTVTVFAVRRPFLFILVSDDIGVPILIGHIKDPSQ
ncbi:plasma protease C1 inhibitor isoform X2 [Rana temporaria]|uniref:plasma protease C1 inhibitor isoform X2 n=1 Tax=Rana temporaria TaxID=8407 RepID=UPI001AAC9B0A|nr:plasma protease C1 inhibitor isoform X2 [Rana temporaria]